LESSQKTICFSRVICAFLSQGKALCKNHTLFLLVLDILIIMRQDDIQAGVKRESDLKSDTTPHKKQGKK
jgi:hypothetical protein